MWRGIVQMATLLVLALALTGCASMGGYLVDRGRDAADVFTATVGMGAGAKVRAGPLQLGTLYGIDMYGLRGGSFGDVVWYETCTREMLFPFPFRLLDSKLGIGGFGEERFCYGCPREVPNKRGKGYVAPVPFPLVGTPRQPEYYTQLEVYIGAFGSLRLGFNPGELADFILGWTTLDIYGDDLEQRERRAGRQAGN